MKREAKLEIWNFPEIYLLIQKSLEHILKAYMFFYVRD